ncbi:MAG: hypothetical protein UU12_C0004G0010 [Candidatus Woesebacteria bacterium GW2011_GWA2_40_7b]|uniref:PIN domain-containing protein n=1 Tax=Candidatus Woesebacteria bacterium GW2011_GWA2_40_7b TaxID=1618563 RepID=A0A0G0T2J7_9BACT|nr:MAG: hypothetical protein UU12_C0004G0010 [Candidatus Woesebacteria bacterium GW2011_GWA2_40_7b]
MDANIKNFIVDASYLLSVLLPDEASSEESKKHLTMIINRTYKFFAPKILEFEVCNSIKTTVIRNRIGKTSAEKILTRFNKIPINYLDINRERVLDLSINKNLTFYDASYLYLARINKYKLLTLDKKLEKL